MRAAATWMLLGLAEGALWGAAAANCVWGGHSNDPKCRSPGYAQDYPACALWQRADRQPIPCQGRVGGHECEFGPGGSPRPVPGSWHLHVFFPNVNCTNCTAPYFTEARPGFSYAGAMQLRGLLAHQLNQLTEQITGRPPRDPIDPLRAAADPSYNQCMDQYFIVAGAPANFHREPCIFEVDRVKELGPFTDPASELGYPNYSFLLPGDVWTPGLLANLTSWLLAEVRPRWGQYDMLLHPNTGCEVRDHLEPASIRWFGTAHPLLARIFSCRSLGCNQACPHNKTAALPAPADCPLNFDAQANV